jgi:hypothetical protein
MYAGGGALTLSRIPTLTLSRIPTLTLSRIPTLHFHEFRPSHFHEFPTLLSATLATRFGPWHISLP